MKMSSLVFAANRSHYFKMNAVVHDKLTSGRALISSSNVSGGDALQFASA